jgi:hypothetical protein
LICIKVSAPRPAKNDWADLSILPDIEQVNGRKAANDETHRHDIAGSYSSRLLAGDNGAR